MDTLYITLNLNSSTNELFSISKDNTISDNIISTQDLLEVELVDYNNFIELMGHSHVILTDVTLGTELIMFNRMKLFEHDEEYNILNISSYLKSYNEYSDTDKDIIDRFILLLNK